MSGPAHLFTFVGHETWIIPPMLIAAGADVNALEPVFGAVPLHKAIYNGTPTLSTGWWRRPALILITRGQAMATHRCSTRCGTAMILMHDC